MEKVLISLSILLSLCTCQLRWDSKDYLNWMYQYMPMSDSIAYNQEWWIKNIDKTLEVREKMSWGISEEDFKHFVLPLRVNNEYLDDFRTTYADTLCKRVKGMNMEQAVMEINHWCYEQATYHGSDGRTMSPMATARSGFGRCGEESVLLVAALRAVGIPSRQVYTPRWAHTDDNHAWVEAWVDGKWRFLGACEPEAVLDLGWFNGPVSRAMFLTTNVFGDYKGSNSVLSKNECYTVINLIGNYNPSRFSTVKVVNHQGNPVEGAEVDFKLFNYGEFFQINKMKTSPTGEVRIETGLGSVFVLAHKGENFGLASLDTEELTIVLNHKYGEEFSESFNLVPPGENPLPNNATLEQEKIHKIRITQGDAIRNAKDKSNPAIRTFKEKYGAKAEGLLTCLSKKDMDDISFEVLEDALLNSKTEEAEILSPRVELEQLLPIRSYIKELGLDKSLKSYEDVEEWVSKNIRLDNRKNPHFFRIPPYNVLKAKRADARSIDILKVALCRAIGLKANLDKINGKTSMYLASHKKAELKLQYTDEKLEYYKNFTISMINPDFKTKLLELPYDKTLIKNIHFPAQIPSYYILSTGKRLSDGSVLAKVDFFNLKANTLNIKEINLRQEKELLEIKGKFEPAKIEVTLGENQIKTIKNLAGEKAVILAFLGENDEPSIHAVRNFKKLNKNLGKYKTKVLIFDNQALKDFSKDIILCKAPSLYESFIKDLQIKEPHKPLIILANPQGEIYYFSQGYNPILSNHLEEILKSF